MTEKLHEITFEDISKNRTPQGKKAKAHVVTGDMVKEEEDKKQGVAYDKEMVF